MKVFLGLDIGGSSRNGICIMDEHLQILHHEKIEYERSKTKGYHRRKVSDRVAKLVIEYGCCGIIVEAVRLYRGGHISKLSNILSLSKMIGSIIDSCYQNAGIYQVQVQTWKSKILGNKCATKDDSVSYVNRVYNLDLTHDEADSVCLAMYGILFVDGTDKDNCLTDR